jgi:hypothetical protein
MTNRRSTWLLLLSLALIGVLRLDAPVCAASPQFNYETEIISRYFSPFPGFPPIVFASITPPRMTPFIRVQRGQEYDVTYDYPDRLVTYTRRLRKNVKMVPVSSNLEAFVNHSISLSQESIAGDVRRQSLVREQKKKAGGLFQFTIPIPSRAFETIFGEGGAGLKVSGYRKISFSGMSSWTDGRESALNPQSKFPTLRMEQYYKLDIEGTIGSKISVKVSQDSHNDLPLANRLLLRYKGAEDDILQSVEAGNTTLSLPSTRFLAYSTRVQGLFGIKLEAQLADVAITAIASQEKGSTESVQISAGTSSTATRVIREIEYKKRTIFDLGRLAVLQNNRAASDTLIPEPEKYDFYPGDSIINAVVYVDDMTSDNNERLSRTVGICYVDPQDTTSDDPLSEYRSLGYFERAEDYYVEPLQHYVLFTRSTPQSNAVIGVYLEVLHKRPDGTRYIDTVGNISSDTLRLRLIKPQINTKVNHHVWEYEWKNVYWLGGSNLNVDQMDIAVYRGTLVGSNQQVNTSDLNDQDGIPYLQILGLDLGDDNGADCNCPPDGQVDRRARLDNILGLLVFPDRHPFDSRYSFYKGQGADTTGVLLKERVGELYSVSQEGIVSQSSKYYIAITSRERGQASIDLNATNIIEGSEVITYGNERLVKGKDYNIEYSMGSLTLLDDKFTEPGANLSITYEKAPFFSLARKTLLGTRLEYTPSRDFRLGTTLLYKSDKSTNRKPKVGEETSKALVWDADFNYKFSNNLLTKLANALPLVTATAESYVQLSGEVAQSRPNPNVDGQVYIDDFEGAKESFQLGILRGDWRHASKPLTIVDSLSERAHLAWYNPDVLFPISEIWNREAGQGETKTTTVLTVQFQPVDHRRLRDTVNNVIDTLSVESQIEPERSWNGFMRNISVGVVKQLAGVQLLEMRVKGDTGILHIDLGRISEDINGDGQLTTEDKYSNNVLDDSLDYGLDGIPDRLEFGYNSVTAPDPTGDNFDANNVWRINGTERNGSDQEGGGNFPDTEDENRNGLETPNSYFSYRVDLSDTTFYVPDTRNEYGWKTIRIPLRDPLSIDAVVGNPVWTDIWFARVWLDGASSYYISNPYRIDIASMELLSTTWADSFYVADSLRSGPVTFDVAVMNNEIDGRYTSPPGVGGYYDQTRDVVEAEQSLLLTFQGLNARVLVNTPDSGLILAADTGLAIRKFIRANNYMGYGKLEAFVYGNILEGDSVRFFFRLGTDKDAYYEYRTIVKPGWAPENHVFIDFSKVTGLKAELLDARARGEDSSLVRVDATGKYVVKIKSSGNDPTLTRMQYFAMGVVNLDPSTKATGEVWVDELRLTDVRDDVGMAARLSVDGNVSDLFSYSFGYSTQDPFYRGIANTAKGGSADNLGSGQTMTAYNASGRTDLGRFLPRSLELDLPISIGWSQNVEEPLLRSGTDIIVPEDLKKIETSVSISKFFNVSERFSKKTKNPLFTVFLNRLSSSFSYSISEGHRATQPKFLNERYSARADLSLGANKPPTITPLAWAKKLKLPFKVAGTKLYLYPKKLTFRGEVTGSFSKSINQNGLNPVLNKRDFAGTVDLGFNIFESLDGSYSFTTNRDLRDPKKVNITFNPKKLRLGVEQSYRQSFRAGYSPNLFSFLSHKFDFSSDYNDTYRGGQGGDFVHNANSRVTGSVAATFKHQALIGSNSRTSDRRRADSTFSFFDLFGTALTGIRYITDAVNPLQAKVSVTRNVVYPALVDKARLPFRFGFSDDPGVALAQSSGGTVSGRPSRNLNKSFSTSSGVSLFAGISMDVSFTRDSRESFEAINSTKSIGKVWPDLKFNLRSVKGLWYIGKAINAVAPSSAFRRTTESRIQVATGQPFEETERKAFSPLISFTVDPFRSLKTTFRYEISTSTATSYSTTSGKLQSISKTGTRNATFTLSYSFRSPTGIKLPLLGRIKFESAMQTTLDVSLNKSSRENANAGTNFAYVKNEDKSNLSIRPGAQYSFSRSVTGGLTARWQDTNDLQTRRKSHTRELGFWVEMRF